MPIREILRAVVFLHRLADDRDFLRTVDCIPDSQMKVLEEELKIRQNEGEVETVQIGRMRYQAATLSVYQNGVDKFLNLIDEVRLHSSMDRATPSENGTPMKYYLTDVLERTIELRRDGSLMPEFDSEEEARKEALAYVGEGAISTRKDSLESERIYKSIGDPSNILMIHTRPHSSAE